MLLVGNPTPCSSSDALCYTLQQLESSLLQRIYSWLKVAKCWDVVYPLRFTAWESGSQEKKKKNVERVEHLGILERGP